MHIDNIRIHSKDKSTTEVSARIRSRLFRRSFRLSYTFDSRFGDYLTDCGDPFVLAALPVCSYHGEEIVVQAPVTSGLLDRIPHLINKLDDFFSTFSQVPIICDVKEATDLPGERKRLTAAFFSLGLDSLYTLAKHKHEIDVLIIRASELEDWEEEYERLVIKGALATLEKLGSRAQVLVVKSNMWNLAEGLVNMQDHYYALSMVSIANLFSNKIGRTYMAAGLPPDHLIPISEHPDLAALWSTDTMQVILDSPMRRLDKVLELADMPGIFEYLRVCNYHSVKSLNCGWCSKCVSSSINLHVAGVLDQCGTLPHEIHTERIRFLVAGAIHIGWLDCERWIALLGDSPADISLRSELTEWLAKADPAAAKTFVEDSELAWELAKQGHFVQAMDMFRRLLVIDPFDSELHFQMGFCLLWSSGNKGEALACFRKASEYGCDEFLVRYHIALLYLFSGNLVEGYARIKQVRRIRPKGFMIRATKDLARWLLIRTKVYKRFMAHYRARLKR